MAIDSVITIDCHTPQISGYYRGQTPVINLDASYLAVKYFKHKLQKGVFKYFMCHICLATRQEFHNCKSRPSWPRAHNPTTGEIQSRRNGFGDFCPSGESRCTS